MAEETFTDPEALRQLTAHDRAGKPVGPVDQVYVDDWTGRPEWATVRLGPVGAAGEDADETFVPLLGASAGTNGELRLDCDLDAIRSAPAIGADQHLGLDQEQELYLHYGLTPPPGEASGAPGVGPERPTAPVTGHEQELENVKELAEEPDAPAPRLRRFAATDPDTATAGASEVRGGNR